MKLSIIIPTAGNNPERVKNLEETLSCLQKQTYQDWELLLVEQSLDGSLYREGLQCDKFVPLYDPYNRGFNISWVRNVGVRQARGERVMIMDADHVFEDNYLERVMQFEGDPFFSGAEFFVWTKKHQRDTFFHSRNLEALLRARNGFRPLNGRVGWACIICFDRAWYLEQFVGYIENFFRYGWEDVEGVHRIARLLGKKVPELHRVRGVRVAHLFHGGRDSNTHNRQLNSAYLQADHREIIDQLKRAGIGNLEGPRLIEEYAL